jgi:hypothetical protein
MNMPVLSPSPEIQLAQPAVRSQVFPSPRLIHASEYFQAILFFFNAQHDCCGSKCRAVVDFESVVQERHTTGRKQTGIKHSDTDIYFINMHALHNADLIRDTLPRNLTAPIPCFPDRDAKRKEFATLLRVSGPAKRAATAKKSKETREKKKMAKAAGGKDMAPVDSDSEEEEELGPEQDMEE